MSAGFESEKYYVATLYEVGPKGWTPVNVIALDSPAKYLTLSTGQVVGFGPSESSVHAPAGTEPQSATADCSTAGSPEGGRP
ncbi:MAG TPA: hypothetical protein VEG63_10545 [Candidatus Acidoferrales bacterium]|nr:hypothetical protein [Candidatus Acidoferrales bacterium]